MFAVKILMQAVIVAGAVFQQQRRGPRLTRLMATGQKILVARGIARFLVPHLGPAIGDRRQTAHRARA